MIRRIVILAFVFASAISQSQWTLQDYYSENPELSRTTALLFESMTDSQRVAQMIVTSLGKLGKPIDYVRDLVINKRVGGVIFLAGDPAEFRLQITELQMLDPDWPLLMSMDAEPSLFNRRMPGTPKVKPTKDLLLGAEIADAVRIIDSTLLAVGFHQNFAPVLDLSASNEAIGNRTFGSDSATVVPRAAQFVRMSQQDQIVATVKHFPGHGRVAGDTHKQLVYINGPLTEVGLYRPLIDSGVISVMVGHIAVENNEKFGTAGLPSTLSTNVVTGLLREEMGFRGIIVTDAMNMGAVSAIKNASVQAARAGCDIILMPPDERAAQKGILEEMAKDDAFRMQVYASVDRIIRLKVCLGLLN